MNKYRERLDVGNVSRGAEGPSFGGARRLRNLWGPVQNKSIGFLFKIIKNFKTVTAEL